MKRFRGVLAFLTLALAVWTPGLAHAQGLSGQIGGSVLDSSKGAVPGATVTVRNTATAVTREIVTDSEGLFVFTNLFAGTYDLRVTLTGFRTYEQKGLVLSATERLAVPPITLEVGGVAGGRDRRGLGAARTDTERRALGHHPGRRNRGNPAARPRFPGPAAGHAGRGRHQRAQRPGLERLPRHANQRPQRSADGDVVRRRLQQGHRVRRGQLRDALARFDCGSEGSDLELPGRVRPGGRREHHRRDQERQLPVQRIGGLLQAARRPDRELLGAAAHLRRDRRHVAVVRDAALPLRQLGVHAGWASARPGHDFQRATRQAVLLLLAGPAAANRSVPGEQHHAVGARAQRRLLADAEQRRAAPVHPQSIQRASLQREQRWPRLLPGQRDPAEHDPPDGPADAESVPVAGSRAGG